MSLAALGGLLPPKPLSSLLLTLARLHAPPVRHKTLARLVGGTGKVYVIGKHAGMLLTGLVACISEPTGVGDSSRFDKADRQRPALIHVHGPALCFTTQDHTRHLEHSHITTGCVSIANAAHQALPGRGFYPNSLAQGTAISCRLGFGDRGRHPGEVEAWCLLLRCRLWAQE